MARLVLMKKATVGLGKIHVRVSYTLGGKEEHHTIKIGELESIFELKNQIEQEFQVPAAIQDLYLNGQKLGQGGLKALGIVDGSVLILKENSQKASASLAVPIGQQSNQPLVFYRRLSSR